MCLLNLCFTLRNNFCHVFRNASSHSNFSSKLFQISTKHTKIINREYAAVQALIKRSGLQDLSQLSNSISSRQYHSSPKCYQQPGGGNPGDPKKPPDKDDEDKDKIPSLLAKAFLWMLTAYMFIAVLSLMFPNSNQPEVVRYVSWNEFLYQMLAKGEVEQIIVRPDIEIVTIVLQDGAIIKGKRVENRTYHMNVIDVNKFEDKLREAERRYVGTWIVYFSVSESKVISKI